MITAGLGIALSVSACQPDHKQTQNVEVANAPLPQIHARLLDIIQTGDQAKIEKNATAMAEAALALSRIGAKPLGENTPDLAQEWKAAATALQPGLQEVAYRGRVKGPAYRKKILAAGATEILQEIYYASEKAELSLQTLSGKTISDQSLELSIVEQAGNVMGKAEAVCTLKLNAEPASCQWLPLWTAKYNITITNHGKSPVPYLLVTN